MHQNSLKNGKLFLILLNDGWMVDLAMGSFGFLTIFLIFWHPWDPWICIRSVCWKWNLKQIEAIPPSVNNLLSIVAWLRSTSTVRKRKTRKKWDYFTSKRPSRGLKRFSIESKVHTYLLCCTFFNLCKTRF